MACVWCGVQDLIVIHSLVETVNPPRTIQSAPRRRSRVETVMKDKKESPSLFPGFWIFTRHS